jgi:hypothetical protein
MKPNWPEIEREMLAEREAMLAADGLDPQLAVEMTRKSIADLQAAHEARIRAAAKEKFMADCKRSADRARERERRMHAET